MTGSRIILRLALGVLCGVVQVLLPAVFSTGSTAMSATSSAQNFGKASGPVTTAPAVPSFFGLDNATLGGLSLLTIILFIFLPSTIFSILVRRWAEKKAHDYLE